MILESLFFYASKLTSYLIHLDNLLIVVLLFSLLLLLLKKWLLVAKTLSIVSSTLLFLITFLPLGNFLLFPLENRFSIPKNLPKNIAGIIVLGGSESPEASDFWGAPQFGSGAERLMVLPKLSSNYPKIPIIISGGYNGLFGQYDAAEISESWLKNAGIKNPIRIEKRSRNTWENAQLSKPLAADTNRPWLLITSAFHMPRAVGVFRQLKWNIIPYPVDHKTHQFNANPNFSANLTTLRTAGHEWLGLLIYHISGKTPTLFPRP